MEEWPEWQRVYKYGTLVIWPPDRVGEVVNRLRHQYDPVSQSFCGAHITLTQPFLRQPSSNEWVELCEVVSSFESFEIQYGPINTFLPYPCIWFEIHPSELVLVIRQALHATGMFNLDLPHTEDFIPHMTVTEGQSDIDVTEELYTKLRDEIISALVSSETNGSGNHRYRAAKLNEITTLPDQDILLKMRGSKASYAGFLADVLRENPNNRTANALLPSAVIDAFNAVKGWLSI